MVPPSFAALSREQPLWANQTIMPVACLRGLPARSTLVHCGAISSRSFRIFFTGNNYGLYTGRPLSACYQHCYSSLQGFCDIQIVLLPTREVITQAETLCQAFFCAKPRFFAGQTLFHRLIWCPRPPGAAIGPQNPGWQPRPAPAGRVPDNLRANGPSGR